jgi:hypothetical protein
MRVRLGGAETPDIWSASTCYNFPLSSMNDFYF